MRTRPRATSRELRLAIACLPRHTREAMLSGISANDIIVGAYATSDGICPMLAAHRNGGRTNFIGFAGAWDRFASRDGRGDRGRRASDRELRVLRVHLEASLLEDDAPASDLTRARAEHDGLVRERERRQARALGRSQSRAREQAAERRRESGSPHVHPGDPDRRSELDSRPGWSWSRLVRRYDDYERLLEHLDHDSIRVAGPEPVAAGRGSRR